MAVGPMPKPLHDLAGLFMVVVGGAIAIGWLNNRGRRDRGGKTSGDRRGSDDALHHHSRWTGDDAGDGHHWADGGDGR